VHAGYEDCDDGNNNNADGCEADCSYPYCGNNITDPGEECDDGNNNDGDGCDSNCTLPACGNYIVDAGEDCDLGDRNGLGYQGDVGYACSTLCYYE
jgi:cysteine-rich repeat protein